LSAKVREGVSIASRDAVWLLSNFAALNQQAVDLDSLARECIPPIHLDTLANVADRLGLVATELQIADLPSAPLPLAVQVRPDGDSDAGSEWVFVLQVDAKGALSARQDGKPPGYLPLEELHQQMTGIALRCVARAAAVKDPDAATQQNREFGFGWFIPELLKHKKIWREVLIASLVLQLLALGFPLFTQAIIDKVIVHRTQSTLVALATGMAVFILFTSCLTWIRQYLILHTGNRVDAVLGGHVFEHLFRLPPLYFQHRPTGVIAARLQGIESIRDFVSSAAVTLILDLPFLVIFVAIMFWYSVSLTWIVLAILGLIIGASALVAPLYRKRLNEQFLRGAANQAFVTEYVSGLETVKSLQLEPQLNRRYGDLLANFLGASYRTRQLGNTYNTFSSGLEQMMSLLILAFGAYIVMTKPSFTVGMLVAFQMFASRLSQPMLRLVGLWQQFQQARISVARLGDVMNAPTEPYRLTRSRSPAGRGAIQIDDLAFRYAENLPYLYDGFALSVTPGQLVAIMGPSGAGKSTLTKLLLGFFQPTRGSLRIDGVDIRHLSANELRSHFGVVPQETTLFSGTILDNLRIANPFASFEQVVAACKMAEIHGTIEALPGGYETEIGERGAGLSGGQRQRIAIARALIKGPKILLFDEATSSLDVSTAEQLGRTINALKGKATILFIAHLLPRSLQPDHVVRIGEKLTVVTPNRSEIHAAPGAEMQLAGADQS
jgi:subfamily B ATP-binding cassette protein HlyB/CyaB